MVYRKNNLKKLRIQKEDAPDSVNKVEKILQGAMQEFLLHGYAATSMDKVTASAGVSKATVYSYFQDKEGLFKALVERLAQDRFNLIFGDEPLKGEPEIVLRRLGLKALNEMVKDDEFCPFKRMMIGECDRFPELAQFFVASLIKPAIDTISQYIADHPELKIPDPEATARIFVGSIADFVMIQEIMHSREIIPMEGDRLIDCLMHLILSNKI